MEPGVPLPASRGPSLLGPPQFPAAPSQDPWELPASLKGWPQLVPHCLVREDPPFPVPAMFPPHPLALTTLSTPQWRAFLPGLKFEVIGSAHISLYTGAGLAPLCGWGGSLRDGLQVGTGRGEGHSGQHPHLPSPDESALKMDHVAHIPQSPASHVEGPLLQKEPRADMLRPDPRDTFFLSERGPVGWGERQRLWAAGLRPPFLQLLEWSLRVWRMCWSPAPMRPPMWSRTFPSRDTRDCSL